MRQSAFGFAALAWLAITGCQESESRHATSTGTSAATSASAPAKAGTKSAAPPERTLTDGLRIAELRVGDGSMAESGHVIAVHYTGWLTDGTKFDSSRDRGKPYSFMLGHVPPAVIAGWEEGIRGMRVGGMRRLTIPPALAYAEHGYGSVIPPNATLVFELELVDVK